MANQHSAGKFIGKLLKYPEKSVWEGGDQTGVTKLWRADHLWPNTLIETMFFIVVLTPFCWVKYCFLILFWLLYEHCYKFECWVSLYLKDSSVCDYRRHCHSQIHCKRNNSHKKSKTNMLSLFNLQVYRWEEGIRGQKTLYYYIIFKSYTGEERGEDLKLAGPLKIP